MTPVHLAKEAIKVADSTVGYLSKAICYRVAMSHVAIWISAQDESTHPTAVLNAAAGAIKLINQHFSK